MPGSESNSTLAVEHEVISSGIPGNAPRHR